MTEYTIKALGRQGDGIADGPVFVPLALPGEKVSGTLNGNRVVDIRILEPVSDRVSPPCKHFKACGGCQMQYASDEFVATWKHDVVEAALSAQDLKTVLRGVATSPERSRRRAKITARRTKSGSIAGFHARASDAVIDVQDCVLVTPTLSSGFAFARAIAEVGATRKGEISVQCTEVQDGLDVSVAGGKPLDLELRGTLPGLALDFGVVRLTWDGELVAQSSKPHVRIGSADVTLPPGAFLQATDHAQGVLQSVVMEATSGASRVADLFAGCGTFALRLAERGPVVAVEGDKTTVRALQESANHAALTHPIKAVARDLFGDPLLAAELEKFDAVVLDPPRSGALAQVMQLATSKVSTVAYVSCDPATFARDAKILTEGGYTLDWLQIVDQFRWSPHVELAAQFTRPHMSRGNG